MAWLGVVASAQIAAMCLRCLSAITRVPTRRRSQPENDFADPLPHHGSREGPLTRPVWDNPGVDGLVVLQPARESDLPVLERLTGDPEAAGEFSWFGWQASPWPRRWEENRLLGEDLGTLMVVHGDERAGFVQWHRRQLPRTGYCWNVGIALLPAARGRAYGSCAQRLLARYLFAHTLAHRLEAVTEVDNIAEQRALQKAGFTREGITRGAGWRDGAWRDGVTYGFLRTDPAP